MFRKAVQTSLSSILVFVLHGTVVFAGTTNSTGQSAANSTSNVASSLGTIGGNPVWVALKLFLSLGILIVLVVVTIRFLAKRTGVGRAQGDVQVLAARQLAPGKSVQVIETYGQRLLIGVGDQVTVLANLEKTEEPSDSFAELLSERLETLRGRQIERESTGE